MLAGCFTEKGADDLKRVAGPNLKTVLLNVTSEESIQKAMEWAKKEVGDKGERAVHSLHFCYLSQNMFLIFKIFFPLRTLGACE